MSQFAVHLTRRDPARNMARYYALSLDRTLFGELVVTRRWGRIGGAGQARHDPVTSEMQGLVLLLRTLAAKRRRGYAPIPATGSGARSH
jgi:predicted DNA-binding WGR domain protein